MASDGFSAKAVEFAQKALEADPKLLEAQELLAAWRSKITIPRRPIHGSRQGDRDVAGSAGRDGNPRHHRLAERQDRSSEWMDGF